MNEQKQIEEMCKDFKCCVSCEMFGGYVDDDGKIVEGYCNDRLPENCVECGISTTQAKVLVNAGYRKLDNHAIVVLRKAKGLENRIKKETAREIIAMFADKNNITEQDLINAIAKRYEVEV